MAKNAKKTSSIATHEARRRKVKQRAGSKEIRKKTFDQLTDEEKDGLLKSLAIHAGFIADDPE